MTDTLPTLRVDTLDTLKALMDDVASRHEILREDGLEDSPDAADLVAALSVLTELAGRAASSGFPATIVVDDANVYREIRVLVEKLDNSSPVLFNGVQLEG